LISCIRFLSFATEKTTFFAIHTATTMTTRPVSILDSLFANVWLSPILIAVLIGLFAVEFLDGHDRYWQVV
jgi:hypothetical protein